MLTGSTPDISAILQFHWYQRVYYAVDDTSFPSSSRKASGYFVGFADHVGHALTYAILTDDTQRIIHRSRVRTAEDPSSVNSRADKWGEDRAPHQFINTRKNKNPTKEKQSNHNVPMPIIDVEELIGKTFPKIDDNGNTEGFTIVENIGKHKKDITSSQGHVQF